MSSDSNRIKITNHDQDQHKDQPFSQKCPSTSNKAADDQNGINAVTGGRSGIKIETNKIP